MIRIRPRGTALIESALWIPILMGLFVGMVQLARVSFTYYTLHKVLYNLARSAGTASGLNFCADDGSLDQIKAFALAGIPGDTTTTILPNLTAEQIELRIERVSPDTGTLDECDCSSSGCDTSSGGQPPDFVVASIPDGYPITLTFVGLALEPIPLRAQVRVPFGGS
jgi:hypothetical protein